MSWRFARMLVCVTAVWQPTWIYAQADEYEVSIDPAFMETCLSNGKTDEERAACIGIGAENCVENDAEFLTTILRALCAISEREYWDERMNTTMAHLLAAFVQSDAALRDDNTTPYPKGLALQEMMTAWRIYRDQACVFEASLWGWGSGSGLVEVECLLRVTAEHTLYLEQQPDGDF